MIGSQKEFQQECGETGIPVFRKHNGDTGDLATRKEADSKEKERDRTKEQEKESPDSNFSRPSMMTPMMAFTLVEKEKVEATEKRIGAKAEEKAEREIQ